MDYSHAWELMILYKDALQEPLALSMFIQTNEDVDSLVIFDGFKVVQEDTDERHIVISDKNDNTIWFWIAGKRKGWIELDFWQRLFTLKGLAKLTKDNPLTLTQCATN